MLSKIKTFLNRKKTDRTDRKVNNNQTGLDQKIQQPDQTGRQQLEKSTHWTRPEVRNRSILTSRPDPTRLKHH